MKDDFTRTHMHKLYRNFYGHSGMIMNCACVLWKRGQTHHVLSGSVCNLHGGLELLFDIGSASS